MAVWMLDSAYAPTAGQCQQARAAGIAVWAGYLPGHGQLNAWTPSQFATVAASGIVPVGIWFGADGAEASQAAHRYGLTTVALDVEAGDGGNYSPEWARGARAGGLRTVLYGLPSTCSAYGRYFDATWAASYTYPRMPGVGPKQAVQYWNSHDEFGVGVDRSIADAWFLGGAPAPAPTGGGHVITDPVQQDIYSCLVDLSIYASGRQFPPVGGTHDVQVADRDNLLHAIFSGQSTGQDIVHQQVDTNPHR